jgi:hypothetical protein
MVGLTAAALGSFALQALFLFDDEKVPNEAAVALAPTTGWVTLLGAVALAALFVRNSELWRRWWFQAEDPRSIGLFRIVFGFFVICNVNDLWEYFEFLFTDEGIFTADTARQVHASAQFKGFGDGFGEEDPWGFFDFWGFVEFLKGPKYSLLYFWDTPTFFWAHLWAFEIIATLFMIGFWTRTTGVLTFFLMNSLFFRNHLFWEGTELVYRVFLAYLICAKSGHAYSVDNWLRCRKLHRRGLLSTRDGPGGGAGVAPSDEHPRGLQAIYRLIPAWPRRLMMLQLAVLYACTGILKNGGVWAKGDAVYYAWNMDHFYRFYPQKISAIFGTNLLRLATWVAHWGEALFFFCFLGMLIGFALREKVPAATGLGRVLNRLCLATIVFVSGALIWVTWEVHHVPPIHKGAFVGAWVALLLAIWWLYERLGRKPFVVAEGRGPAWVVGGVVGGGVALLGILAAAHGRWWIGWLGLMLMWSAASGAALARIRKKRPQWWARVRAFSTKIDHAWLAKWPLGRRIWIAWHLAIMGGIFFLMNIGQFQTGVLSLGIIYFAGNEVAVGLRFAGRKLARIGVPMSASVKRGEPPLPAEDPTLPHLHRDGARMPQWALWSGIGIAVSAVLVRVVLAPEWPWQRIWWIGALFLAGVAFQVARASKRRPLSVVNPDTGEPRVPWGYGPLGRFTIGLLLVWHITGVALWLAPEKDSLSTWRNEGRKVWTVWLTTTQTDQGWGMFAPNPPRSNVFLKVLVYDDQGTAWDMRTDVYAPEKKPIPWIWNDRIRKMNRRIIGGESGDTSWYRKWHARYYCRKWAMDNGGESPERVELVKVWYKIPSPEEVRDKGFYVPEDLLERTGSEKIEHTEHCKRTVMGQLPDWIRERHGLPPLPANEKYRPWLKHKKKAWERAKEKQREAEEAEKLEEGEKESSRKLGD